MRISFKGVYVFIYFIFIFSDTVCVCIHMLYVCILSKVAWMVSTSFQKLFLAWKLPCMSIVERQTSCAKISVWIVQSPSHSSGMLSVFDQYGTSQKIEKKYQYSLCFQPEERMRQKSVWISMWSNPRNALDRKVYEYQCGQTWGTHKTEKYMPISWDLCRNVLASCRQLACDHPY
jgi:hypothetical protein